MVGSNLGRDIDYTDWGLLSVSSVTQGKYQNSAWDQDMAGSFQILTKSSRIVSLPTDAI
jgi:hypothetical protein